MNYQAVTKAFDRLDRLLQFSLFSIITTMR